MEISIIPRFLIREISRNSVQQINWNILLSSLLILSFFMFFPQSTINTIPHFCLFEKLFGIPCIGCGMTRSMYSIFHLKIVDSLNLNPCGILVILYLFIQILIRILSIWKEHLFPKIQKISNKLNKLLIYTSLLFWIVRIINLKS